MRIQQPQFRNQSVELFHVQLHGFGDLRQLVVRQFIKMFADQRPECAVRFAGTVQLQKQTLFQIPCSNARRVKRLHQSQCFFRRFQRGSDRLGSVRQRAFEISFLIQTANHVFRAFPHIRRNFRKPELFQQGFLQGSFRHNGVKHILPPALKIIGIVLFFRFRRFQHPVKMLFVIFPVGVHHVLLRRRRIIRGVFGRQSVSGLHIICIEIIRGIVSFVHRGIFVQFKHRDARHFLFNLVFKIHRRLGKQIQGRQLLRRQRHVLFLFLLLR